MAHLPTSLFPCICRGSDLHLFRKRCLVKRDRSNDDARERRFSALAGMFVGREP
jgi:hypothetical protein